MLLVLDKDKELYLFASMEDAQGWLEAIDIENHEYEFCNLSGQRFIPEITSPVTAFRSGAFILRADGLPDATLPSSFLSRADRLGRACRDITTIDQLKTRIERVKA